MAHYRPKSPKNTQNGQKKFFQKSDIRKCLNITRDEGQKYWPDEKTRFHLFGRSKIPEIQ